MKNRLLQFCAIALFFAVPVTAQQSPASPAGAPATREDVLRLFAVMHVHEQMRSTMDAMVGQMREMMRETIKKRSPEMTEDQFSKIESMQSDMLKSLDLDGMLDDMIPVYQKHLEKSDVDAMVAFYSAPTGQKLIREQPKMVAESMQAVYARMQKSMDEMMTRVEKMAKDEAEKQKSQQPSAKPEQRKN
jgi:hypothetical protein